MTEHRSMQRFLTCLLLAVAATVASDAACRRLGNVQGNPSSMAERGVHRGVPSLETCAMLGCLRLRGGGKMRKIRDGSRMELHHLDYLIKDKPKQHKPWSLEEEMRDEANKENRKEERREGGFSEKDLQEEGDKSEAAEGSMEDPEDLVVLNTEGADSEEQDKARYVHPWITLEIRKEA